MTASLMRALLQKPVVLNLAARHLRFVIRRHRWAMSFLIVCFLMRPWARHLIHRTCLIFARRSFLSKLGSIALMSAPSNDQWNHIIIVETFKIGSSPPLCCTNEELPSGWSIFVKCCCVFYFHQNDFGCQRSGSSCLGIGVEHYTKKN